MKRLNLLLAAAVLLGTLAGCGRRVYIYEERTTEETHPAVTGDESPSSSSRTLYINRHGKVYLKEETTTEETHPVITGD